VPLDLAILTMAQSKKHILVVDDHEAVREVLVAMLEDQGYRVTEANGGVSMREKLRQNVVYDAIILDALMPGEQSETLAFHARELGIRVVMISGSPEKLEFAQANRLQVLQKPFLNEELADALTEAFDSGEAGQRAENPMP
jgi:CheY-like chemotaxis protein